MKTNRVLGRFMAVMLALVLSITSFPITALADDEDISTQSATSTLRFDFGDAGAVDGYIGVVASEKYDQSKGYGFKNPNVIQNVSASGTGVCSDAVQFLSGDGHVFNVDLPSGVYKITVTTGDVQSASITAEGRQQLLFMTGCGAVDSFTIPVTDGQLNIYPSSGVGGVYSLSALEIEQVSTGTETKPTIWIYGDSTVCNYYNKPDDYAKGWGQLLGNHVDTNTYDIRNMSINGMTAVLLDGHDSFEVAEYYGKSSDILILSMGISDYVSTQIDGSQYMSAMTSLVQRAKATGMKVYLVKQQGAIRDCLTYPIITKKWYSDEIDAIAASENVDIIDIFHPWLEFCLEKTDDIVPMYYQTMDNGGKNETHLNKLGADIVAEMVAEQLFPRTVSIDNSNINYNIDKSGFDTASTVIYQAEPEDGPIKNPHKGFVMEITKPYQFSPDYSIKKSDGSIVVLGSRDNRAWDVVSVCYGVLKWNELNPAEDVYDWQQIDDMLEACEEHGMTYGIRVLPYSTGSGTDENYGATHNFVPQWVFDNGASMDVATYKYGDKDGNLSTQIKIPHWSDEAYIRAHKKFITALAERYDGDPRVEFIELRAFGNFGEWHTSQFVGNDMPSIDQQKDMIAHYASVFENTTVCALSDVKGEVYDYALSLGVTKRNDGLVMTPNEEWDLIPTYRANLPVLGDYHHQYNYMKNLAPDNPGRFIPWTETRFWETIEIPHLTMLSLDMDSTFGRQIYLEQKELIDEATHRLGYNFTVTSAKRNGNKLLVEIKNTGLAPAFFDIDLCAEITDASGNKKENFGEPIRISSGTFKDGSEQVFIFEYSGTLTDSDTICLAMYESSKISANGLADPTVRFDNKNTLANYRLKLVSESATSPKSFVEGYSLDIKTGSYYFNIYTNIQSKYSNGSNYSLKLELPDGSVTDTKVKDAVTKNLNGTNYQIFTVNIAAKDMYRTVTVSLYNDQGQIVGETVSVSLYEYASALKTRNSSYANFVDAMLRYGSYAQNYFYNMNNGSQVKQYTMSDYASIAGKISSGSGITTDGYIGSSLLLKNQIILRHYFDRYVSGATKKGDFYYIEKAFNPSEFNQVIEGYDYSVNDYIKKALTSSSDTKLKSLMAALYEYEVEAKKIK